MNGFKVGPAEASIALQFLTKTDAIDWHATALGLKTLLAGDREEWDSFDALFEAYWFRRGRAKTQASRRRGPQRQAAKPLVWARHLPPEDGGETGGAPSATDNDGSEDDAEDGTGRLVASDRRHTLTTDLRQLVSPEDIAEAERVAQRLAMAIRYRLSRRRKMASHGRQLDMRRTIRRNMSRGAEPLELCMRRRPTRPINLVLLLDISGSMKLYSRYFLSFIRGLVGSTIRVDAYFFHTRLMRMTDAFLEPDPLRSLARVSLMSEGFGGGTRIAGSLATFNNRYARRALDSRSIVIVMSDGYDTDPPEGLARELERLKLRARRLIWLNPLLGWRDYEPVARGMAASLPYIDCFATAHTLESLAALEPELSRL